MRKKVTTTLVLVAGLLGVAVPVLAALYLSHRQSMDAEVRLAMTMAEEVLRRADDVGDQAITAYRSLAEVDGFGPCSDADIERMRRLELQLSSIEVVGRVDGDRLICSSMGLPPGGIPLGPPLWTSSLDSRIRPAVDLGLGDGNQFLVLQKANFAVAVNPQVLLDSFEDRQDFSMGIVGYTSRKLMSGRGAFNERWLNRLGNEHSAVLFDGNHLVALRKSNTYDVAAFVAVPVALLRSRLYSFAKVLVPISLIPGALLCFGIFRLARHRASLASQLRAALKRREFSLHYQPIMELASGRIVGFEALMRWRNREGTRLRPDLFIPAAEDCGLIPQFTEYALECATREIPRLIAFCPGVFVSINLASSDLHSERTIDLLRNLLQTPGIKPENIVVEATEHSFLDPQRAGLIVAGIRALGIRVAIDDFGTGYCGLSHLTNLETDFLKIDKVFVEAAGTESATGQVALHIIRIAKTLGLKIIGEGVENEGQAAFLREHGVEFGQGWWFHAAMPLEKILKLPSGNSGAG